MKTKKKEEEETGGFGNSDRQQNKTKGRVLLANDASLILNLTLSLVVLCCDGCFFVVGGLSRSKD